MQRMWIVGWLVMWFGTWGVAGEIGFVEDFVLSRDREAALRQLIPGTDDYYYWNCVHLLNQQQFAQVDQLLQQWVQRRGEIPQVWEIRTRRALLAYDQNPQQTLEYLRNRFGIHYPYQKEEPDAEPNLATALDQALISRQAFAQRALQNHQNNLHGFEDVSLEWLLLQQLNPDQRRQLLGRLSRPDYPQLVKLVADDLAHPNSGGFGSLPIHQQLLLPQLEELVRLRGDLLNQEQFVSTYLSKLQPGPDSDWRNNPQELAAYLDRLAAFVDRLAPVHNSLKGLVLYQRLLLDQTQGVFNKQRFINYIKLPRNVVYISRTMRESEELRRFACNLNADYQPATLLAPIRNDEPLVRSHLLHFFVEAQSTREFEPYINDAYLKSLFAEAKIVNGLGDPEQWAAMLNPTQFRQLRDRIDLDFDPTNRNRFAEADPVSLTLQVKNVNILLVKVFEINAENYYRRVGKEIDTDINLDGLIANHEQTYQYNDAPLRRISRKFDFPMINRPGVYVIDFIGNGQSSRALIRKGELRYTIRTTGAGQELTVLNRQGEQVSNARVWLAGHEYTAGEQGRVLIPFSSRPGPQSIVITAPLGPAGESFSILGRIQHEGDNYLLQVGWHVDREQLLTRKKAQLIIRPQLTVNGSPVSTQLLKNLKLTLLATDLEGISTQTVVSDLKLFDDRETVHEFQVPQRLAQLLVRLQGDVQSLITSEFQTVSSEREFQLNGIDRTDKVEDLHLVRSNGSYLLELRGRTGERRVSRAVTVVVKHRHFKESYSVSLKTDPQGRIVLGNLAEIEWIAATGPEGTSHRWVLPSDQHTFPAAVHARVGEVITLPYLGPADAAPAAVVSLLELRGDRFTVDRLQHVALQQGLIQISKLPPGDYSLFDKTTRSTVQIRVVDGPLVNGFAVGALRQLEQARLAPVQIERIEPGAESVQVQLRNLSPFTRLHVFGTRMLPEYSAYEGLSRVRAPGLYRFEYRPSQSVYLTGRNIGDEYRYIIDRKYAQKFPGNLLERPSLLLNPWAIRDTETGEQIAAAGGVFGRGGGMGGMEADRAQMEAALAAAGEDHFANLDFLSAGSAVLLNLVPNEQGVVEIPRAALTKHQDLHVVAVDPLHTTYRSLSLPEESIPFLDLRLADGLDPAQHYTRRKAVNILRAGEPFVIADVTTARFEVYDSLARVYELYATLSGDAQLLEFAQLLQWPELQAEQRSELYSKYASHELNLFLYRKDPEFFRKVIQPYLANKRDQTFVDRFLLEADLSEYLQPWKYAQLNPVERILLAQRVDGEREKTARHLRDRLALLPRDLDRLNYLFDTAVRRSGLEGGGGVPLSRMVDEFFDSKQNFLNGAMGGMGGGAFGAGAPGAPLATPAPAPGAAAPLPPESEARQLRLQMKSETDAAEKAADGLRRRSGASNRGLVQDAEQLGNAAEDKKLLEAQTRERELVRQLYRRLGKTKEWAENNYYQLPIDQQTAELIEVSNFWKDYAEHDPAGPFLSTHLAEASNSFAEILLALAVLDLPFTPAEHQYAFDNARLTLTPGSPVILFHEQIQPAEAPVAGAQVLVSQNFFRQGDRQRIEDGETVDKFVTDEFLTHVVYGAQVVITNPTSTRQRLNVLLQVPRGAMAVMNSQPTATRLVDLEPYHTQTLEYHFYFPAAGEYVHFPVHVARNEQLIAAAAPATFKVVDRPTRPDTESWDYISQQGALADVVRFLETHNVEELDLDRIAWRLHERQAFDTLLPLLAQRHVYSDTLWSFSLLHNDVAAAREYLQHAEQIVNECGGRLSSPLLTIDPVARRTYQHLEYRPLVNARTHALGKRRQIVNEVFHQQYHAFLKELAYERQLSAADYLGLTYYLLLQDRIAEALETFARVNREQISSKMQYDYCAAYLKFFTDEPEQARAIAAQYTAHPVDRWRKTFQAVVAQLDEAAGQDAAVLDARNRDQQQAALAASEPSFEIKVEGRQLTLDYQNLVSARVNFYLMDVELLFSRNPFVQEFGSEFATIQPNHSLTVELPANQRQFAMPLPEMFQTRNVLVEVVAGGKTRTQPYFSNALAVQVIENYGEVKVTHRETGRPVAKAYVKVYAQTAGGETKFYKDGYTDLRGRFDYASLNTSDLDAAQKFSILVLSDEFGALVREATPPKE
jgi:hypothetical protein